MVSQERALVEFFLKFFEIGLNTRPFHSYLGSLFKKLTPHFLVPLELLTGRGFLTNFFLLCRGGGDAFLTMKSQNPGK